MELLGETRSVCPICLKNIKAEIIKNCEEVQIHKTCENHGDFRETVWRGLPDYTTWIKKNSPNLDKIKKTVSSHLNCPHQCGLCSAHGQKTCTVLLELCEQCNLHCPVCFANSDKASFDTKFKTLTDVIKQIDFLYQRAGLGILQLSGGEPTLYPNLAEVVKYASSLFSAVQLNSNGILLAEDKNLAKNLKDAGLSWVFLQFDGVSDEIHKKIRGKALRAIKEQAIENCKNVELNIVLVSTLVSGVNDCEIGELLEFSVKNFPTVRGLHFQPMTFSGRNALAQNSKHISLPEVMQKLAEQSRGQIKLEDAKPSSCEHSACSFSCRYYVKENQVLEYISQDDFACSCEQIERDDAPKRSIETTIRSWNNEKNNLNFSSNNSLINCNLDAFDKFIQKARAKTFSISCMAFQDVHTLDLERLQNCCVHIYDGKDKLIPFCAYNLTSLQGKKLYR